MGFMRLDGWTIGAPAHLEKVCFDLYREEWSHFIRLPSSEWRPIAEYQNRGF